MKKYIAIIAMALPLSMAFAGTTANVVLSGTVPNAVNISASGTGSYNSLDLSASQVDLVVVNVTEQSNDPSGYTVTVASTNAGVLKNGSNTFAYTAKYNGSAFSLSATPQTVTTVNSQSGVVSSNKTVTVSYTGSPYYNLFAGPYSDTLTFTISAN